MADFTEAGVADLAPLGEGVDINWHAAVVAVVAIPGFPFLETVSSSPTHWRVRATGPGSFTFLVVEPNGSGGWQVVGTVRHDVFPGWEYQQDCNPGQEVRIM